MADEDEGGDIKLDTQIAILKKKLFVQAIFKWLLIPLAMAMFMGTVVSTAYFMEKLKTQEKRSPLNRYKNIRVDVNVGEEKVKQRFERYKEYMESAEVTTSLDEAGQYFGLLIESEEDLISLLENYRSAMFNIASNVRGSGEGHRFYRHQIREQIHRAEKRIERLKAIQKGDYDLQG